MSKSFKNPWAPNDHSFTVGTKLLDSTLKHLLEDASADPQEGAFDAEDEHCLQVIAGQLGVEYRGDSHGDIIERCIKVNDEEFKRRKAARKVSDKRTDEQIQHTKAVLKAAAHVLKKIRGNPGKNSGFLYQTQDQRIIKEVTKSIKRGDHSVGYVSLFSGLKRKLIAILDGATGVWTFKVDPEGDDGQEVTCPGIPFVYVTDDGRVIPDVGINRTKKRKIWHPMEREMRTVCVPEDKDGVLSLASLADPDSGIDKFADVAANSFNQKYQALFQKGLPFRERQLRDTMPREWSAELDTQGLQPFVPYPFPPSNGGPPSSGGPSSSSDKRVVRRYSASAAAPPPTPPSTTRVTRSSAKSSGTVDRI